VRDWALVERSAAIEVAEGPESTRPGRSDGNGRVTLYYGGVADALGPKPNAR